MKQSEHNIIQSVLDEVSALKDTTITTLAGKIDDLEDNLRVTQIRITKQVSASIEDNVCHKIDGIQNTTMNTIRSKIDNLEGGLINAFCEKLADMQTNLISPSAIKLTN